MSDITVNDVVGYTFAQPGNDTTYMLVERIEDGNAHCRDLLFKFDITVPLDRLWKASEKELDSTIDAYGRLVSYRKLADERRKRLRT